MSTKKRPNRIRIKNVEIRKIIAEYPTSRRVVYAAYWKPIKEEEK